MAATKKPATTKAATTAKAEKPAKKEEPKYEPFPGMPAPTLTQEQIDEENLPSTER